MNSIRQPSRKRKHEKSAMQGWHGYEMFKLKLRRRSLTPAEYEREIKLYCDEHGL